VNDNRNVIETLGQEARVLVQARRLPMGKLNKAEISGVRRDYVAYVEKHGIFNAQVARETGLSASVLSQFRGAAYKGNNDKVARTLNDWMEASERKRKTALPGDYISTTVAEEMRIISGVAVTDAAMAAIVAPSGSGKTMTLKVLADKFHGRYIYCTEDLTPRAFLREVARSVDLPGHRKMTKADLIAEVVDKLKGTGRPLFLDEAHRLPPDVLPRLRSIHDQAGVPIIMAGTHEILTRINDRSDGRGQFASRCLQYNVLEHVMDAEDPGGAEGRGAGGRGRPLFTEDEVRQFLDGLQVKFTGDAFELAWAIACLPHHGCLRTVRRIVMLVRRDQADRAEPITRDEISRALSMLFGRMGTVINRHAEHHIRVASAAA